MNSRESILLATFELASERGLGNISLSQIAKKVGIQKASLYSHFASKEDLIDSLYLFLRERAKASTDNSPVDYGKLVSGRSAQDILTQAVANYTKITTDEDMRKFYKFMHSERVFNKDAARMMVTETEKMILATKQLFYAMQVHHVMDFENADMAAVSFAMAIHSLIDYQNDKAFAEAEDITPLTDAYIKHFVRAYRRRE